MGTAGGKRRRGAGWGVGVLVVGEAVHAIVSASPDAVLEPAAIIAHCRSLIAGYKCPRTVEVREQPLPLSGANKIDKPRLRAPFWQDRASRIV